MAFKLPGVPPQQRQLRARPPRNEYAKVRDRDYGKPVDLLAYLARTMFGEL